MTDNVSRRFIPSTSTLQAFEAAARLASFTDAASELNLTQSAISRQIRTLEDQLGVELFIRERQTVRPTPAGEAYAREIRTALRLIGSATLNLSVNPDGGNFTLAILPTFGTRWLAPRLTHFTRDNPGITINLVTRTRPVDFNREAVDAAISHGFGEWAGTQSLYLKSETLIPVASPEFIRRHNIKSPADIDGRMLIHLATRPDSWAQWFRLHEFESDLPPGIVFDQFAMAAQGAATGLGIALMPELLIKPELEQGELARVLDMPMEGREKYYLVWPTERANLPPLRRFRDWLAQEAAASID